MKRGLIIGGVWLLLASASTAAPAMAEPVTIRSRSGQFVVHGLPLNKTLLNYAPTSGVAYARLDPMLLAVAGENIKDAVLSALNLTDRWQGRIAASIRPVTRDNEEIVVASMRFTDGWQYQLEIPEYVNRQRLVKALVEVLLLEVAQRNAGERRLELPPWLAPGLAAHLTASAPSPLVLEPESLTNRKRRMEYALKQTRETLRASPVTLDELNWPGPKTDPAAYEAAAHLMVRELLRAGGGVALNNMLFKLRDHMNWQVAFLQAFNFRSLRETDKWWTLQLVQFAGRESLATWSLAEAGAHLEEMLATSAQVRHDSNQLPITTRVSLQQMLQEWDFDKQSPILRQKLRQLEALRLRSPAAFGALVHEYHERLSQYFDRRSRLGNRTQRSEAVRALVGETTQKLAELDVRREVALRGASGATAAVEASP